MDDGVDRGRPPGRGLCGNVENPTRAFRAATEDIRPVFFRGSAVGEAHDGPPGGLPRDRRGPPGLESVDQVVGQGRWLPSNRIQAGPHPPPPPSIMRFDHRENRRREEGKNSKPFAGG